MSKRTYVFLSTTVASANFVVIFLEAYFPEKMQHQAWTISVIAIIFALTLSYIITGSLLVRRLWVFFQKHYNRQRRTLICAIVVISASLCTLFTRYVV